MTQLSGQSDSAKRKRDVRGESNLTEKAAAIKLILASRDLSGSGSANRALNMIEWVLDGEAPKPGNSDNRSVTMFIEAIKATKP